MTEYKKGYFTLGGIEYFFDGYLAFPIKHVECDSGNGDIARYEEGYNYYEFNKETELFDINVHGENHETNYECSSCYEMFSELDDSEIKQDILNGFKVNGA